MKIKTLTWGICVWFHLQPRKSGSSLTKAALLLSSFLHVLAAALAPALPLSQAAPLLLPSTAVTHQKAETKARFLLWGVYFPFCLFFGHFGEVNQLTEVPRKYQRQHKENNGIIWHGGGAGKGAPVSQADTELCPLRSDRGTGSNWHLIGSTFRGRRTDWYVKPIVTLHVLVHTYAANHTWQPVSSLVV